jgi:hypothetical protein
MGIAVQSASDETYRGTFFYGGLIAPVTFWEGVFAKRWDKRVLSGPPRIPYIHMTEIRSPGWRKENNISDADADHRVEKAIDVMCKLKHPTLFSFKFNRDLFNKVVKRKIRNANGAVIWMQPDYLGFLGYVYVVLHGVRKVIPDTEKVDFLVEKNGEVTKNLYDFYSAIPEFLASIGKHDLIPLMGGIIPGDKDRSPLQAADVFCWHHRRDSENDLVGSDLARWKKLRSRRHYSFGAMSDKALHELAEASDQREAELGGWK